MGTAVHTEVWPEMCAEVGWVSTSVTLEAVGMDEMDQEECVKREKKQPEEDPKAPDGHREESTGETWNLPGRSKASRFSILEAKKGKLGRWEGGGSTDWSVAGKSVGVGIGMFPTHLATRRQLLTLA